MKPMQPRRSAISRLWPKLALGGFGVVGLLVVLVVLGYLPWGKAGDPNRGKVAVLVSNQPVSAYTMVTRDHLLLPESLAPSVVWLRPEEVNPKIINHAGKLIGRVLKKDKPKGYAFTEDDFFPEKTRPGLVAGIPPGKRALALDADKLKGIHSLKTGDHFDLLASAPLDEKKGSGTAVGERRAAVRVVVHNGVVVVPASVWKPPENGKGPPPKTGGPEIVIAAEPEEIVKLSEVLALKQEIVAIARSGHPDDPGAASLTPELLPPPPSTVNAPRRTVIETIIGSKHHLLEFGPARGPSEKKEPRTPPEVPKDGKAAPRVAQADGE
jgi:hypothetical protein